MVISAINFLRFWQYWSHLIQIYFFHQKQIRLNRSGHRELRKNPNCHTRGIFHRPAAIGFFSGVEIIPYSESACQTEPKSKFSWILVPGNLFKNQFEVCMGAICRITPRRILYWAELSSSCPAVKRWFQKIFL